MSNCYAHAFDFFDGRKLPLVGFRRVVLKAYIRRSPERRIVIVEFRVELPER